MEYHRLINYNLYNNLMILKINIYKIKMKQLEMIIIKIYG